MDLIKKSVIELRNLAKELEIENVSKLKKNELISAIEEAEKSKNNNEIEKEEKADNLNECIDTQENDIVDGQGRYNLTSDSDKYVEGILELLPDGYGFLRGDNYLSTSEDVYVSPVQIKRFRLDTGDKVKGIMRIPKEAEKFPALIYVGEVNRTTSRICYEKEKV